MIMHRMKIIQVCYITPQGGGIETYVTNLLNSLPKFGFDLGLIGLNPNYDPAKSGYDYIRITNKNNRYSYLFNLCLKTYFLRRSSQAIICTHRSDDMFPFILFHKRAPKICTLHGKTLENIRIKHPKIMAKIYGLIERFTLRRMSNNRNVTIAVDETTRRFYEQSYPWLKGKIMVIPSGINLERFKPMDKTKMQKKYGFNPLDKNIMFIGRLEKEKNLDFLIRTFRLLKESEKDVHLIFVGDGRERVSLANLVNRTGLEKYVTFLGAIRHQKIPELLNCASVLILCSEYEGSPTIVKEALACAVPVVSTNVGDVAKVIRNRFVGRIVERDEKRFAEAIIEMLHLDQERVKRECIAISKEFDFDNVAGRIAEIYKKLERC